jgi:hypothetical protein
MSTLPKVAEIRRTGAGAFGLFLDGVEFPWYITREQVEVRNLAPDCENAPFELKIGIIIDGQVIGAEEFNEALDEEADRSRVRQADHRDLLIEMA